MEWPHITLASLRHVMHKPPLNPSNVPCLVQFSMPHSKWGPVFPLALIPPIFSMSNMACLVCVCHLGSKIGLPWWCRFGAFSGRGRSSSIFCWPVQPWCLVSYISPLPHLLLIFTGHLIRRMTLKPLCTNTLSLWVISLEIKFPAFWTIQEDCFNI